jgi:sec-independent protein translocase protein TatA
LKDELIMLNTNTLAFISMPQGAEWLVILAMGLLIFGKRLPDVGKGIGQAISQFKKGLRSADEEPEQIEAAVEETPRLKDDAKAAPAHKFDPYTGKPIGA